MTTPHLLTITHVDDDDIEWELSCLGVEDACRLWLPCPQCENITGEYAEFLRESVLEDEEAHGQPHQIIDGELMCPTDRCYLLYEPDWSQHAVYSLVYSGHALITGTYLVEHQYVGDQDVFLSMIGATPQWFELLSPEQQTALLLTSAMR